MERLMIFINRINKKTILIILVVLISIFFAVYYFITNPRVKSQDIKAGVDYLKSLESKDVSTVKPRISEYRREERRRLLYEGELSVWDMFEDYAMMGDSRAVGFYYHDFLDESRCFAFGGATIRNIEESLEDLKKLNPRYIFLCYGLNDVGIGYWETGEEYASEFKDIILNLKTEMPETNIVVSSILIAREPAFDDNPAWYNIPTFNEAVMQMCIENNITYVDNTNLCDEYVDLWDIDGIHLKKTFYQYWAANLIAEVDDEN